MLNFLTANAIPIISALVTALMAFAYVKFKVNQHDKDLQRVENKFDKEIIEMKICCKEEFILVRTEIDDVKSVFMDTNSKILDKLDELAKDVKDISVDLAFFKGQQSKTR